MSESLELAVKAKLPILEFDFDEAKNELAATLEKYDNVVVTQETLAADKKLAQELSAKATAINNQRKEKVKEISAPIKTFEDNMKSLASMCTEVSGKIKSQVKVFEDERLVALEKNLANTLKAMREEAEIKEEFYQPDSCFAGLIKLGSLTPKDGLKKPAKDALAAIVSSELALQQKVEYRLLQLENESHKAGLDTPLVRFNVESFLLAERDDVYSHSLAKMVESELERQNIRKQKEADAEAAAKAKAAAEVEVKQSPEPEEKPVSERLAERFSEPEVNHEEPLMEDQFGAPVHHDDFGNANYDQYDEYAEQMMNEQESHQQEPKVELKEGHSLFITTAVFKVSAPSQVTEEMIGNKISEMLFNAGVTTLDDIKVERHG